MSPSRLQSLRRAVPAVRAVARLLLASVGGYGLAVALAYALARGLPVARSEATVFASLAAILAMPVAAIWTYGTPRLGRAAGGILGLTAVLAAAAWMIGQPA